MPTETIVIRTSQLTKQYQDLIAVDQVNLEICRGEVFGLLGPNGAGKTTTISMLLGLIRPTSGSAQVLGYDIHRQSTKALRRVGALVEPAFYPSLSARDNLWVLAQMSGGVARQRIDAILELVGLERRVNTPVATFSMGMKQRLGLAAALMHNPDLLILDEPTNGLDPAGIIEIRQLIRRLADQEAKTILLSSHLLYEIQMVCDRVMIMHKGKTVAMGPVKELLGNAEQIEIHIQDAERALGILKGLSWVANAELYNGALLVGAPGERAAELTATLAAHGLYLHGMRLVERSLESYFLDITAKDIRGDHHA